MRRTPCAAVRDEGALRMRRAPCGYCGCDLVQEPPTAYKLVRLYRRAADSRPYEIYPANAVGADTIRSCRNYRLRADLFAFPVCRFAVGGDMSPPYKGVNGLGKL